MRVLFPLIAVVLAACSSNSKTIDGRCTQDFVDDYNRVALERAFFGEAGRACEQFFSKHDTVSCDALVDGARKAISSWDLKYFCDRYTANHLSGESETIAPR